jgi:endoglucanase
LPRSPFVARLAPALPALRFLASAACLAVVACAGDAGTGPAPTTSDDAAPKGGTEATTPLVTYANAIAGAKMWVDPASAAQLTVNAWRTARPADAAQLEKLAAQPQVRWIGNWNSDVRADVDAFVTRMSTDGALPVFVAYNIPHRDCGGLSGGASVTSPDAYRRWIADFAAGIGARRAAVILEPDALAGMDCLSSADQQTRVDLLAYAVQTFRARGSVAVYLDAGNPGWQTPTTMSGRLARAGIALAQGFALNVSNFIGTAENIAYGQKLSALVGGKHFVIDTGRNGAGANGEWCNPAGRALGPRPTTETGTSLVDAFLWVKAPGESDGACAGAPAAGSWMPDYALGLAQRAAY